MSTITVNENLVCHCLGITECEVRTAARVRGCCTVREIMNDTTAGTGCTACHRRIEQLLKSAHANAEHQSVSG